MVVIVLFFLFFFFVWGVYRFGVFDYYVDRCGGDPSEGLVMIDVVSVSCLTMLLFCGTMALLFCGHYFQSELCSGRALGLMLCGFLGVMALLVSSCSLLSTLIMWEYLGIVSFFLILFYSNSSGLRATLVTIFVSRFGDVCLFGLILFFSLFYGSGGFLVSLMLLLVVLTKSACFPFVSWLLEAMRAPTPVSSLVHSSTLVAAGVWFLFRYGNSFISFCSDLEVLFFVLSLSTILISSCCSVVFFDLKKMVALSTCNNVSWCVVFFLFGDVLLGLAQLLSHGVAKCYLFISLGDLMSGASSAQDSRGVFCLSSDRSPLPLFLPTVLVLCLSGVPFIGIFFSKHVLLCDFLWSYSFVCYLLLFLGFFFSCVYSSRLVFLLCGFGLSSGVSSYGSLFLVVSGLSVILSGAFNFCLVDGAEELSFVTPASSAFLLFVQTVGFCLGSFLYFFPVTGLVSYLGYVVWGCEAFVEVFYGIFSFFRSFFLFLLYRWEYGFVSYVYGSLANARGWLGWGSFKLLFISGVCLFFCCLLLSCCFGVVVHKGFSYPWGLWPNSVFSAVVNFLLCCLSKSMF